MADTAQLPSGVPVREGGSLRVPRRLLVWVPPVSAINRNEEREAEVAAQWKEEREALRVAKANGFMDCQDIRDALGYDHLNPGTGEPYSAMGVAYRWMRDAGVGIAYPLEEDGHRITSLSYRSGCNGSDFPHILEVKEAYYAEIAAREKKSWDDAQKAKDDFDRQKAEALAALILRQTEERAAQAAEQAERYAAIDAARDAEIQSLIAEADAADAQILTPSRRAEVIAVLRSYTGPLTKRGLPKRKPLNEHAGFRIEGWEKRECWPEVQL